MFNHLAGLFLSGIAALGADVCSAAPCPCRSPRTGGPRTSLPGLQTAWLLLLFMRMARSHFMTPLDPRIFPRPSPLLMHFGTATIFGPHLQPPACLVVTSASCCPPCPPQPEPCPLSPPPRADPASHAHRAARRLLLGVVAR